MCEIGPVNMPLGPTREHSSKLSSIYHFKYALLSLFSTKRLFSTSLLQQNGLKGLWKSTITFRCNFEVNILTRLGIFCRLCNHIHILHNIGTIREKGRDLTQSYDKSPYTNRNDKRAKWQHKQRHKKVRLHSGCGPT